MNSWLLIAGLNACSCLLNAGLVAARGEPLASMLASALSGLIVVMGVWIIADEAWPHRLGDGRHA